MTDRVAQGNVLSNFINPDSLPQHALRLIAFGKLHLVLGVNPLAPHGTPRQRPTSKESESPSKDVTDTSGGGDDVTPSVGVKRDSVDDMEGAEAVKKIKLES